MLLDTLRAATREYVEHLSESLDGQDIPFKVVTVPAIKVPMVELIRVAKSEKGSICHSWKRGDTLQVAWTSKGQDAVTIYAEAD